MTADVTAALQPTVTVLAPRSAVTAVALVLHGGRADSFDPVESSQLAVARMRPFAASLHKGGADRGLAVWSLQYRRRGWNGSARSPVEDVRWALAEIRRAHGGVPVALVGHSMGGRAALYAADDPSVTSVVALAPWIEQGDPVAPIRDRSLLVLHGALDVVTSAPASRRYAMAAAPIARQVARGIVRADIHAMVVRWPLWHRLTTAWVLADLGGEESAAVRRLREAGARGEFGLRV